jgi:DMSO/TMAO reductase YedYZ molybdopterin-dependent catalytic subunit
MSQVCRPDHLSRLAGAVATAALLLPAVLPADALAAIAEAGQAPPPQRWFTVAVLLGGAGLAAAEQLHLTNKTAQARLDIMLSHCG